MNFVSRIRRSRSRRVDAKAQGIYFEPRLPKALREALALLLTTLVVTITAQTRCDRTKALLGMLGVAMATGLRTPDGRRSIDYSRFHDIMLIGN